MAPLTVKGLRKSTDPMYKQTSIVLGPVSRPLSYGAKRKAERVPKWTRSQRHQGVRA